MSEDDDESRAGRLRDRRKRTRNRTSTQDQEAEEETDKPDKPDEPAETSKPSKQTKTSKSEGGSGATSSVKDEQTGTYMYLPDSLVSELAYQFKINSAEYERATDEAFEKNRHWYPLIISLGLEQVKEMEPEEMHSRLTEDKWG